MWGGERDGGSDSMLALVAGDEQGSLKHAHARGCQWRHHVPPTPSTYRMYFESRAKGIFPQIRYGM